MRDEPPRPPEAVQTSPCLGSSLGEQAWNLNVLSNWCSFGKTAGHHDPSDCSGEAASAASPAHVLV